MRAALLAVVSLSESGAREDSCKIRCPNFVDASTHATV